MKPKAKRKITVIAIKKPMTKRKKRAPRKKNPNMNLKYGVFQLHGNERMFVCGVINKQVADAIAIMCNEWSKHGASFVVTPL